MKKINLSYLKSLYASAVSLKSMPLPINLQPREKIIVAAAGIVLVGLILARLVIFPIIDRGDRLRNQIRSQTDALAEMQRLKAEYEATTRFNRGMEQQLKQRPRNFTLFSFADRLANQSGIKQNIVYMKPSTSNLKNSPYSLSMVEIKLNTLTMHQLTTFLHGIEDPTQLVWVKRLSITRDDKQEGLINSVVQVETLQQ